MNYFEEYINQLLSLKQGKKTKVDVHFIISEPLNSFCYEINQNIRKHSVSLINMEVESIILPHISLFMGMVDSYKMIENLFSMVSSYSKTISPFIINPTKLYFKGFSPSTPQYLFIDSLESYLLMQQKVILNNQLKDIVYPNDWNILKERAHITVGCYRNLTNSVRSLVDEYTSIPSCKISQIGISLTGKKGVCLSLLKVFDL